MREIHLHSSMDRLKAVMFIKSNPFNFHLHSSMDRLKVVKNKKF